MSVRETESQTREGEISREGETVRVSECQRDRHTEKQKDRQSDRLTYRENNIENIYINKLNKISK